MPYCREETFVCTLEEMKCHAEKLALELKKGDVVLLNGELGAGKTTLSAFIIKTLTNAKNVTSATFNIVQTYETKDGLKIWHYDLYRLQNNEELEEIGLTEALEDIVIIEWPEIARAYLPIDTINIHIIFMDDYHRMIKISKK